MLFFVVVDHISRLLPIKADEICWRCSDMKFSLELRGYIYLHDQNRKKGGYLRVNIQGLENIFNVKPFKLEEVIRSSWVLWNATNQDARFGYFCCLQGQVGTQDLTCDSGSLNITCTLTAHKVVLIISWFSGWSLIFHFPDQTTYSYGCCRRNSKWFYFWKFYYYKMSASTSTTKRI